MDLKLKTAREIIKAVYEGFGLPANALYNKRRLQEVILPRNTCIYMISKYTGLTDQVIGKLTEISRSNVTVILTQYPAQLPFDLNTKALINAVVIKLDLQEPPVTPKTSRYL